jgi:pimeloyl-ACP methyl ester carboxylesterase
MDAVADIVIALVIAGVVLAILVYAAAKVAEYRHPPLGRIIAVDGTKVHVLERGQGEPIVLLHGNVTMVEEMLSSGLVEKLARAHRVIVIDRPGFGHSPRPRGETWTAERQARVVAATMQALGVPRAIIVAHSWGTLVALSLAQQRPDLVRSLVLLAGYFFPQNDRVDVALVTPVQTPVLGDVLRYTVSPVMGLILTPAIFRKMFQPARVPERFEREFPVSMMLRPWQLRAAAEDGAIMNDEAEKLQRRYKDVRVPVLVLAGSDDQVISTDRQSARLPAELPLARFEAFQAAGHMVHHTAVDGVASAVVRMAAAASQGGMVLDAGAARPSGA